MRIAFKALLFSLCVLSVAFAQTNESMTITTYYPSPYGVYKTLRLHPNNDFAAGDACTVDQEGELSYNLNDHLMLFCDGTSWTQMGGGDASEFLGEIELIADDQLSGATWNLFYNNWTISGPYALAVSNASGTYAIQLDTTSFGRGIFMIEWGGDVEVDAHDDIRNMKVRLLYAVPGSNWLVADTTEVFVDTAFAAPPNPNPDGIYTLSSTGTRSVQLMMKKVNWIRFRITAQKNGADNTAINARLKSGFKCSVTRMASF